MQLYEFLMNMTQYDTRSSSLRDDICSNTGEFVLMMVWSEMSDNLLFQVLTLTSSAISISRTPSPSPLVSRSVISPVQFFADLLLRSLQMALSRFVSARRL